jgi:hypothetical protein
MLKICSKFDRLPANDFLIFCNSTVIEIYDDILKSHGFDGCQMLEYIAAASIGHQRNRNDDITVFIGP